MPRPPSCSCGDCPGCRHRTAARLAYQAMTVEERQAWTARRDPEKVRAADRARHQRDRAKRIDAMKRQQAANPEPASQAKARWIASHPEERRAQNAVSSALRRGVLVKGSCEHAASGECHGRIEAHHEDYSKPLDVAWLCAAHHRAITPRRGPERRAPR